LKNVLLETGFEYDGDGNVTATKTGFFQDFILVVKNNPVKQKTSPMKNEKVRGNHYPRAFYDLNNFMIRGSIRSLRI